MNKSQKVSPSQIGRDRELDKISQLPEHLIDKILSFLPIQDAVRTSILSSNWRFKWTTLSKLVFDDNVVTHESSKLVNIIYTVLLFHSGCPVEKFMFSHKKYKVSTHDVDLWIRYLSKASTIILDFCERESATNLAPSSLFYCEGLTSLRLSNCTVNVSPTFRGFKNLKILCLRSVKSNNVTTMLDKLISGSDVLEDLTLISFRQYSFNCVAPKLKHFCCRGSLIGFGFGGRFNSTFCSPSIFHMEYYEDNTRLSDGHKNSIHLLKFFAPLQSVETLKLDGDVLKSLSVEEVPAMLAEPILLKNLFISGINFKSGKQLLVILCLLRSAPNLKQLKLSAAEKWERSAEVVDEIYESPCSFAQLNSVSLIGIGDTVFEMGFIGILLSSSPVLQKMTIKAASYSKLCPTGSGGDHKLVENMMRLQYPLAQAKLSFL